MNITKSQVTFIEQTLCISFIMKIRLLDQINMFVLNFLWILLRLNTREIFKL